MDVNDQDVLSWKQRFEIALEATMQTIPTAGGFLTTLIFGTKRELHSNRVLSFYQELAEELKGVKKQISSIGELQREELLALIETLTEKVEKEHLQEKRRLFKNYLKNMLFNYIAEDYDDRKFFLETISGMTLLELHTLGRLYSKAGEMIFQDLLPQTIDHYALRGAITRLESYGFILDMGLGVPGDPRYLEGETEFLRHVISLTSFGKKFCDYCLKEPEIR